MKLNKKFLTILEIFIIIIFIQMIFLNNVMALTSTEMQDKLEKIKNGQLNEGSGKLLGDGEYFTGYYYGESCYAFANLVAEKIFGSSHYTNSNDWEWRGNLDDLCIGDVIEYYEPTSSVGLHCFIVTDLNGDNIQVTDSNWGGNNKNQWRRGWTCKNDIYNSSSYAGRGVHAVWHFRNNNLKSFDTKPTLSDFHIHSLSTTQNQIRVRVLASDNTSRVKFKIWRSGYSNDSGTTKDASYNSQARCWEVIFNEEDTKHINDNVCCIEAWGYNNNNTESEHKNINNFVFGKRVYDLGNFTARITYKNNSNYCIGISGNNNGDDLKLKVKNKKDKSQLWNFEEISKGLYKITNVSNGKSFDVEGGEAGKANGCIMQQWNYVSSATQMQFFLQNYNGGYRIVPCNSATLNGIDLEYANVKDNAKIHIWEAENSNNNAQTWKLEKVVNEINLIEKETNIAVGGEKKLELKLTPSSILNDISLVWSSSNESVATVDENGIVKGLSEGKTQITVFQDERPDLVASCEVIVKNVAKGFLLDYETYQINSLDEKVTLNATLDNGDKASVIWKSSKPSVATISSTGVITPVSGGFTYIEAKSEIYGTKKCWIYVCTLITLSDGNQAYAGDLDRNGYITANDASNILSSIGSTDEEKIAMCDIDGNGIIDRNDSNCILDIYKNNGPFKVGKYNPITKIAFDKNKIELNSGETIQIRTTIVPINSTDSSNLIWKSNNPLIAKVDSKGKITAISAGTAVITARSSSGQAVETCEVKVNGEKIEITTIENKLIASKNVMRFSPKIQFNSIVNQENFPILEHNYKIKIYESERGKEKADNTKLGSKNVIRVMDEEKNIIAEYTVIVPGDVTGNGEVKMYDAFTILKDSLFNGKFDELEKLIRDYNGDGVVKMYDAFSFLKQALFN